VRIKDIEEIMESASYAGIGSRIYSEDTTYEFARCMTFIFHACINIKCWTPQQHRFSNHLLAMYTAIYQNNVHVFKIKNDSLGFYFTNYLTVVINGSILLNWYLNLFNCVFSYKSPSLLDARKWLDLESHKSFGQPHSFFSSEAGKVYEAPLVQP